MQEAPNSYEKDEQQERGNYDSADYMEKADGGKVILVGSSPTFSDSSSYVGLTWTNKQSVCGSPHRAQSMGIGHMGTWSVVASTS